MKRRSGATASPKRAMSDAPKAQVVHAPTRAVLALKPTSGVGRRSIALAGRYPMRYHHSCGLSPKDAIESASVQTGWRIEELQSVANENHVEWRRPSRGGSHMVFSAPGVREIVSVPSKRPIKPVYIKQFLALVDAAIEVKRNESQDETKS